ncbi:MAG: preprotein translocase subunit SecA, partial [Pseudomonadota bacterium]|nr:preprotein translocase subunit SecA [Pseudomonadota bacterium]
MAQQDSDQNSKYNYVNPSSKFFKLFLVYDIFMVFII